MSISHRKKDNILGEVPKEVEEVPRGFLQVEEGKSNIEKGNIFSISRKNHYFKPITEKINLRRFTY
jgi:hypothetical protein